MCMHACQFAAREFDVMLTLAKILFQFAKITLSNESVQYLKLFHPSFVTHFSVMNFAYKMHAYLIIKGKSKQMN